MRIRRPAIIIAAILALGVALAAYSSSALVAAARHVPGAHVQVSVIKNGPNTMFHG